MSNIRIDGDAFGSGRFGFLAVNLTDAMLTVDPAVMVSVDLREPGPDPFTGQADGLIRLYELGGTIVDLATGSLDGNPSGDDVVFTGRFNVAAVLPGLEAPFELVNAEVSFKWADIANVRTLAGFETQSMVSVSGQLGLDLDFGVNLESIVTDDSLATSFFIKDATLTGSVTVTADEINATAQIGSIAANLSGGTATGMASVSVRFNDPGSDAADGRISLVELAALDLDALVGTPITNVTGSFDLPVSADPFNLGGVTVGLSGLVSGTHEVIDFSLAAEIVGTIVSGLVIEPLLPGDPSRVTYTKRDGLEIQARARILGVDVSLSGDIAAAGDFSFTPDNRPSQAVLERPVHHNDHSVRERTARLRASG